jgi:hypothetical protein
LCKVAGGQALHAGRVREEPHGRLLDGYGYPGPSSHFPGPAEAELVAQGNRGSVLLRRLFWVFIRRHGPSDLFHRRHASAPWQETQNRRNARAKWSLLLVFSGNTLNIVGLIISVMQI